MRKLYLAFLVAAQFLPWQVRAQVPDSFIGGWDWVSTEYLDGRIETPATLGYSQQYYFGASGEYIVYHDLTTAVQSLWSLGEVIVGPCMIEHLSVMGDATLWYWFLTPGEPAGLVLTDGLDAQPCGVDIPETKRITLTYVGTVPNEVLGWGAVKARFR